MQKCLLITNQCGVFSIHICILLLFVTYDAQSVWPDGNATIGLLFSKYYWAP